jgi:hypothetical protein
MAAGLAEGRLLKPPDSLTCHSDLLITLTEPDLVFQIAHGVKVEHFDSYLTLLISPPLSQRLDAALA